MSHWVQLNRRLTGGVSGRRGLMSWCLGLPSALWCKFKTIRRCIGQKLGNSRPKINTDFIDVFNPWHFNKLKLHGSRRNIGRCVYDWSIQIRCHQLPVPSIPWSLFIPSLANMFENPSLHNPITMCARQGYTEQNITDYFYWECRNL